MLERLEGRVGAAAQAAARKRRAALAARLAAAVPADVAIAQSGDGVTLMGRGLGRRLVLMRAPGWIKELVR